MSAHILRRCICPTAFCPLRFPAYSSDCSHASGSGALRSVSFCLHTARSRPEQRRTGLNPAFLSVVVGLGNNTWDSPFVFLLILRSQTRKSCRYRASRASHFLILRPLTRKSCRYRASRASQIYDKKALDRIYFCQGRINFPRCHLASRQYACTFRILTYPRQLTYVSRHRILRYFLSLCPPWSI